MPSNPPSPTLPLQTSTDDDVEGIASMLENSIDWALMTP